MLRTLYALSLVVFLSLSVAAGSEPDLGELDMSEVNADVLLLDARWDAFYAEEFGYYWAGSGKYSFGDPRFDELEECKGYAKRPFDHGYAFIIRDCKASLVGSNEELPFGLYYILRNDTKEKDDAPIETWNGHLYGSWFSYASYALPMTFLFVFPDDTSPLVGDFTDDLGGAMVTATSYFATGVASGKLSVFDGNLEASSIDGQPIQSWGEIKSKLGP